MTFNVEVVLKGRDHAVTETAIIQAADAASWSDEDVQDVLTEILRAIERAENPKAPRDRAVALRGFSWIVEPANGSDEVVIAIEIPMGAAIAGPFTVAQASLDAAISRIMANQSESWRVPVNQGTTIH